MFRNDFIHAVWFDFRLATTNFWVWLADQFFKITVRKTTRKTQKKELRHLRKKLEKKEFQTFKKKFRKSNAYEREKMLQEMFVRFKDLPFHYENLLKNMDYFYVVYPNSPLEKVDDVDGLADTIADLEQSFNTEGEQDDD